MTNSFPERSASSSSNDLVCFSHLRWDFVFQRPQHLLSRFAKKQRVFFIEEPVFFDGESHFRVEKRENNLHVVQPHIQEGTEGYKVDEILKEELDRLIENHKIQDFVAWYYTPMMLAWSNHIKTATVVYDCMDELSAFKNAPQELRDREAELMSTADLVFTGGQSLYEAKREKRESVHCFPSSIDVDHFAQALQVTEDPEDQKTIAHPRIGFCGVIDERCDLELLREIADMRPDWHFVMIGPVVKINEEDLPRRENIHYLGGKKYDELPNYIAGWDVAMMPFALNESTRFISPTKTPEYLAAGRPVVSTPIRDVVRPYGEKGLVHIASTPEQFVQAIQAAMGEDPVVRMEQVKEFMKDMSWDKTQRHMSDLINEVLRSREQMASAVTV
jgi:glycosyltransferase involved in cell wall biosynthesis